MTNAGIPLPPIPMRGLVSPVTDESYYDNPSGDYIWGPLDIPPLNAGQAYERIFDFGCGCGREARQLLLQTDRPRQYIGLDANREMIDWCQSNLKRDGFSFHHHDVWSAGYARKNSRVRVLPINHFGSGFTMIEANSVFTHLHADQTEFYLDQMRSMLAPLGMIRATWFLFNKKCFPMMNERQNTIFVDELDTTAAVYYDWLYLLNLLRSMKYRIVKIEWSPFVGFHNRIYLAASERFADLSDSVPPGSSVLGF
jgi:SAM-dependent methyltransferase